MLAAPDLWIFFLLVLGVIALPGMDMAYVVSNSLAGGMIAGASATGGIIAGSLVHVTAAATGVALLLTLSPIAFDALLFAGAAYMAWIASRMWRVSLQATAPRQNDPAGPPGEAHSAWLIFRRGMLTCLLNPKAYAFMLAVFPAFLSSPDGRPAVGHRVIAMAAIIVATQAGVYGTAAAMAAGTRKVLAVGDRAQRWMLRSTSAILAVGAICTLILGWKPAIAG